MRKCKFDDIIDDYLFNRLDEEKKQKFEEHYFNCPSCFNRMTERWELISLVKDKGHLIFQDEYVVEEPKGVKWIDKMVSFLTPKQWTVAAVSAILAFIFVFGVIPKLKTPAPQFVINEDTVRGGSIIPLFPEGNIDTVPSHFTWNKIDKDDVEYKIYIYSEELLWTTSTKENTISPPEEIIKRMGTGQKYSWTVKAFSAEGSLIAVSPNIQFKIILPE